MDITCLERKLPEPAAILLLVILVSACATGAQQQATQIQQTETQTNVGVRDSIDGVLAKSDYAHLKTKMFISSGGTDTPPLEYLSDNSRPTKSEIADLYKYYGDTRPCRKIALEGAARVHPAMVNALVTGYDASDKLAIEFVSGRMTWGNFNQQRSSIALQGRQQLSEAQSKIASQLQNQHQFEMAQRQQAIANLQQWASSYTCTSIRPCSRPMKSVGLSGCSVRNGLTPSRSRLISVTGLGARDDSERIIQWF